MFRSKSLFLMALTSGSVLGKSTSVILLGFLATINQVAATIFVLNVIID